MTRVTRAEAARRLGVHKSTIKRWCDKHPALIGPDGLVDPEEIRAHYETVAHPGLQARRGRPAEAAPDPVQPPREGAATLNDHRSRSEKAKADSAELDLAERLGQTLRRDQVEAAVAEAAEILRQAAGQAARDAAERLARIEDVREMEVALDAMVREVLSEGARALEAALAEDSPADAA